MRWIVRMFAVAGLWLTLPGTVAAHGLATTFQSPVPLVVYLAGAALAVALSFAIVIGADIRPGRRAEERTVPVRRWVRVALRTLGIVAFAWIVAQGLAGGSSEGEVATLFLWIYGWVGIAILSAFVAPVWRWLDPFTTIFDAGAWVVRRLGVQGWEPAALSPRLRGWPAVAGLLFFIWLEIAGSLAPLWIVLLAYTIVTLLCMAQFGRDEWREHGETFSVWFGLLNRLATVRQVPFRDDVVVRSSFAQGILLAQWRTPEVVLVAVGTGSILYDGLSQTQPWFGVFGIPSMASQTILLIVFLTGIVAAALLVARPVGLNAIGSGLLPIAVGYLVAHYLTYLLIDGQRIVIAISDPLQRGWDLFGTAFFIPFGDFPAGLVWTLQMLTVIGGHIVGAWAGHARAVESGEPREMRRREVPLAVLMVCLTAVTLWSLGQVVIELSEGGTAAAARP